MHYAARTRSVTFRVNGEDLVPGSAYSCTRSLYFVPGIYEISIQLLSVLLLLLTYDTMHQSNPHTLYVYGTHDRSVTIFIFILHHFYFPA